ncbi:MAG: CPBP family intramembrane metalloprotease [Clostridium sp.]|nr:CPBP family intramembrane metalloprotease [Clostridium sp.]
MTAFDTIINLLLLFLGIKLIRDSGVEEIKITQRNNKAFYFELTWYAFYVMFTFITNKLGIFIVNEMTHWIGLVMYPLMVFLLTYYYNIGIQKVISNILNLIMNIPLYLSLMLIMAGFTEEFFFRGILQNLLQHGALLLYIHLII